MKISKSKVAIIGSGAVGATTAYSLVVQGVAAEVVLVDLNQEKAGGEALDMQHSMEFQRRNVRVGAGGYEECADADIVVITAAAPLNGETDRRAMLDKSASIMRSIVPQVMASGFDGIFLVVSNPVDVMAWLVWKLSGLPASRVIGTGTILETARLKHLIAKAMLIDPRSVDAYVMGEHGDAMMIPWSHVRAGGKSFQIIAKEKGGRLNEIDLEHMVEEVRKSGGYVLKAKGNTQYGIASAVTAIVKAILYDENQIYAVSAYLDGEYGESGIYCGVPAILNRNGVEDIGEFYLTGEEQAQFSGSARVIRENIRRLGEQDIL
ncbi:MAG: L-lactate dehydrogenase [Eubacteriales bacterium]|nr:L-lactate dehydrogenase [Eubacteriales bacterium]